VIAYAIRRALWSAVLFFVITMVTYVIFYVIPTDVRGRFQRTALADSDTRHAIPVHGAVWQEYGQFVWALLHGSLGQSAQTREDVTHILERAAPVTASVVLGGAIIWLVVACTVGVISAIHPRSLVDRTATVFVLIGVSAHPVWIGLIFSYFFGFRLNLLPAEGYCDFFHPPPGATCGGPGQWALHLLLPWITFAFLFAAIYMRMVRASVLETLDEDWVRTARAKGAGEWRVLRSHVLRTAFLPIVTMLGMDIGIALAGSVFIETVYGLPGLGSTVVNAVPRADLPTIMGITLFMTISILVLNLVVDLLYASMDPRIRLGTSVEASR
jgi:peptide/nickel transport system permease protein